METLTEDLTTSSGVLSDGKDKLSQKVEEQGEVIKLVLTQIDVQNEKLTKHEKLIQNLLIQIQELQSRSNPKDIANKSGKDDADWTNIKKGSGVSTEVLSVAEMVKQTAEETMAKSGFVYDEASGLYLDYASGYYYDPVQSLYYNGHTGVYYTYDTENQKYVFHSQAVIPTKSSKQRKKSKSNQNMGRATPKEEKVVETKVKKITCDTNSEVKPDLRGSPISTAVLDDDSKSEECSENDKVKSDDDIEEGEISSSVGSPSCQEDDSDCDTITSNLSEESATAPDPQFPPCIRAIVIESDVETLKKGHLFIVTCTGGSIGREGAQHSILIPDSSIEKHHADILYSDESNEGKYMVRDTGSQTGTFLNGKRISEADEQSEMYEILHGSKLSMGNTSLLLHIHPGTFTCGHCEPGLLIEKEPQSHGSILSKKKKETLRKSEMRKLQKKYGVGPVIPDHLSKLPEAYQDRARHRRITKGSDNPFEKTEVASVDQALKESNKGFKMMSKMGWKEGTSLGRDGIKEPIKLDIKSDRRGLGSASFSPQIPTAFSAGSSGLKKTGNRQSKPEIEECRMKKPRAEVLDKTIKRFKECANEDQK